MTAISVYLTSKSEVSGWMAQKVTKADIKFIY